MRARWWAGIVRNPAHGLFFWSVAVSLCSPVSSLFLYIRSGVVGWVRAASPLAFCCRGAAPLMCASRTQVAGFSFSCATPTCSRRVVSIHDSSPRPTTTSHGCDRTSSLSHASPTRAAMAGYPVGLASSTATSLRYQVEGACIGKRRAARTLVRVQVNCLRRLLRADTWLEAQRQGSNRVRLLRASAQPTGPLHAVSATVTKKDTTRHDRQARHSVHVRYPTQHGGYRHARRMG